MHRLLCVLAITASAVVAVAPASAKAPGGNGLVITMGLPCDGAPAVPIVLVRGAGATGWELDSGQHYVVKTFSVSTTLTFDSGGEIVESFTNTFGEKVGLGTPIRCTGSFSETIPGVGTLTGTITGEIVNVPAGS